MAEWQNALVEARPPELLEEPRALGGADLHRHGLAVLLRDDGTVHVVDEATPGAPVAFRRIVSGR